MGYDGCSRLAFKKVGCIEFILPIVKEAEDGKLFIVVSAMAIAETLHLGTPGNAQDYQIISEFFDSKEVWEQAVDRAVAECARDIRRTHEITGADSLHVATGACDRLADFPYQRWRSAKGEKETNSPTRQ